MTPQQEKLLREVNRKLDQLLNGRNRQWLSASEVIKLTGWSYDQLRRRREAEVVEFKKNASGGYMYALDSIPQLKSVA